MQNQLFVGNLAFATTKEELEEVFAVHGTVTEVKIPIDRTTGRVRGFAFVTFDDPQAAQKALALDGTELNGRPIRVNIAEEKKSGGGAGGSGGRSGNARRSNGNAAGGSREGWW